MGGVVAWWLHFGEVNPEPGGGERNKLVGHLVVKNEWFEGCDAGDVIDGEECIISIMRGLGGHVNCFYSGWDFTCMRGKGSQGDFSQGRRTDCSCGQA